MTSCHRTSPPTLSLLANRFGATLGVVPLRTQTHVAGSAGHVGGGYHRLRKKSIALPTRLSSLSVEFDRETDGRWIAEIPKLPGVMAYGETKREAQQRVYAIALRTIADSVENGSFFTPVSRLFGYGVARG